MYFDLETTGLSGGAGMVAFLAGVGEWTPDGFRTTQFLLPSFAAERALLHALNAYLGDDAVLVTYNGRTFDVPVMEVRGEMQRVPQVVCSLPHLDMLHAARRLWRMSEEGDRSCRLTHLEESVLGVGRVGDVGGFEIPARYFQFVRGGSAALLEPVLLHNRLDLLSLAALTAHAQRLVCEGRERRRADRRRSGSASSTSAAAGWNRRWRAYRSAAEDHWQTRESQARRGARHWRACCGGSDVSRRRPQPGGWCCNSAGARNCSARRARRWPSITSTAVDNWRRRDAMPSRVWSRRSGGESGSSSAGAWPGSSGNSREPSPDRLQLLDRLRRSCPAFAGCLPAEALAKAGARTAMRTATRRV